MTLDTQTTQLLAVTTIFGLFAIAELVMGTFFAPEASTEDNRLDVAVGVTFPIISGLVFAAAKGLSAMLMPEMRDAWAHWPWWAMVLVVYRNNAFYYHALRASCAHAGRWRRALHGELWESPVLLGCALWHRAHHASISACVRTQ